MTLQFKKLSIADKEKIEATVQPYEPFSDFSFLSLYTYNTHDTIEYAYHGNNLVIKFEDYDDNSNFYSFIGTDHVLETTKLLLELSVAEGLRPSLDLLPEITVNADPLMFKNFSIEEDRDNFDYIVSAKDLAALKPEKLPKKRKLVNRFLDLYPECSSKLLDINDPATTTALLSLFDQWALVNKKSVEETQTEKIAIKRLLNNVNNLGNVFCLAIYEKDMLIGFNTFELTNNKYGISSFQKAIKDYTGIYAYMTQQMAKVLNERGCEYINFEQDLGIDGLRSSKLSWHPIKYLKKYTVKPRNRV